MRINTERFVKGIIYAIGGMLSSSGFKALGTWIEAPMLVTIGGGLGTLSVIALVVCILALAVFYLFSNL